MPLRTAAISGCRAGLVRLRPERSAMYVAANSRSGMPPCVTVSAYRSLPEMMGKMALMGESRAGRLHRLELVDPHVGLAEEPDLTIGVGQVRGPLRQRDAVGRLHGIEQVERAARVSRAAHVRDDDHVAPVDEVVHVRVGDRRRVDDELLPVRRLLQEDGEEPVRRCVRPRDGREVHVRAQDGAVGHRHRLVEERARPVRGRLGLPRRRGDRVRRGRGRPEGLHRPGRGGRPLLARDQGRHSEGRQRDDHGQAAHGQPPRDGAHEAAGPLLAPVHVLPVLRPHFQRPPVPTTAGRTCLRRLSCGSRWTPIRRVRYGATAPALCRGGPGSAKSGRNPALSRNGEAPTRGEPSRLTWVDATSPRRKGGSFGTPIGCRSGRTSSSAHDGG